jgi:DNA-binding PadR family transcriptional regulator
MFNRDLDHFRFDEIPHRFIRPGPPENNGPPIPPQFGEAPFLGPKPPFAGHHFRPPLPIGRESFQEIRDFIVLLIISEYPDGITGYQLQDKYNFPRGTLIRTLQELEDKNYLTSREEIIEGRANKFYFITELGKKFLEELKLRWANLFSIMSEITPSKGLKMILFEKIEEFESKEDAIDLFRGLRSWMKTMLQRIENRVQTFKRSKDELDKIIQDIEKMDFLNKDKIKELVEESLKKSEELENKK